MIYDALIAPFADYSFMRRALAGIFALAVSMGPLGVILLLRRMSLMGDAMAHAILPGAAIGYLFAGLSLTAMTIGGMAAACAVVLTAGLVSRSTILGSDAALASAYLLSIALGVTILSMSGSNVDLIHVLFGSALALDNAALLLLAGTSSVSLAALSLMFRPLVWESADPEFLRMASGSGGLTAISFHILVAVNLVAAFHALGALLAVGLMVLPAAAARFWCRSLEGMILAATGAAAASGYAGLLLSYHGGAPAGPAVILAAGAVLAVSILFGGNSGLLRREAAAEAAPPRKIKSMEAS